MTATDTTPPLPTGTLRDRALLPARVARRELGGAVRRQLVAARGAALRSTRLVEQLAGHLPTDPTSAVEVDTAVAFVDITAFTEADPDRALTLVAALDDAVRATHPPVRVVKRLGDGILLASDDTAATVEATVGIVRHFTTATGAQATAGVAAGTCHAWEADLFGPPVNRAARLAATATPQTVLVDGVPDTVTAAAAALDQPGTADTVAAADIVMVDLKGIAANVPALELTIAPAGT